jgi:hypothetical protein
MVFPIISITQRVPIERPTQRQPASQSRSRNHSAFPHQQADRTARTRCALPLRVTTAGRTNSVCRASYVRIAVLRRPSTMSLRPRASRSGTNISVSRACCTPPPSSPATMATVDHEYGTRRWPFRTQSGGARRRSWLRMAARQRLVYARPCRELCSCASCARGDDALERARGNC